MKIYWAAVALVLILAGCTDGGGNFTSAATSRVTASPAPSRTQRPPAPTFQTLPGVAGDGEDQYLSGIAQIGDVLVTAGASHSSGVWHPLFLYSRDDGRSWRVAATSSGIGATVHDTVTTIVTRAGSFYAFGTASGGAAVWTSRGGRVWLRHSIDRSVISWTDRLADVSATPDGFVAVGVRSLPGEFDQPLSWTSSDGLRWIQHSGRSAGLGATAGSDVQMTAVTAGRLGLVAVGHREYEHGKLDVPLVWRSADGATWQAVALPDDLAGSGTRSWFNDVLWTGARYVAVGVGGEETNQRYAGVVASSADAASWSAYSRGPGLVTAEQVYLHAVTTRRGRTVAVGDQCATACTLYGVTDVPDQWHALRVPVADDGDDTSVGQAFTTAAGTVLVVGSANPRHDRDVRIWRSTDGRSYARMPTPAAAIGAARAVYAYDLARGAGRYVVVGSSAGLPVVWSSTDGRHYGRPTALSTDRARSASTITHGPRGWLVTGREFVGDSEQAVVWTSLDGRHWREQGDGVFGRAGTYAYSDLTAAVAWRGWVVVGDRSSNGWPYQSALAARSADDRMWTQAADTASTTAVGGKRVVQHDVRGDVNGNRQMSDVTAVGPQLMAVGYAQATQGATHVEPAAWRSADGRTWSLTFLTRGSARSATVDRVTAAGSTVIGYGTTQRGVVTSGAIWTSQDTGRTWRLQALAGDGGARATVDASVAAATARGFVVGGSVGQPGAARPLLWTSADGLTWRRLALTDRRLAATGDWSVGGVVATGATLVGVATRVIASGSIPVAFTQALR